MKKIFIVSACIVFVVALANVTAMAAQAGDEEGEKVRRDKGDEATEDRGRRAEADGEGGRDRHGRRRRFSISEKEEAELLAALKKHRPEYYERLTEAREDKPFFYRMAIRRMWRWYQRWKTLPDELKDVEIRLQDAKISAWRLAKKIEQSGDEDEKAELKKQLKEILRKHFEAEMAMNEYHIRQLEERLEGLREHLESQKKQQDEIIKDRMQRVIRAASRHTEDGPPRGRRRPEGPPPPRDDMHEPPPPPDHGGPHDESEPAPQRDRGDERQEEKPTTRPAE